MCGNCGGGEDGGKLKVMHLLYDQTMPPTSATLCKMKRLECCMGLTVQGCNDMSEFGRRMALAYATAPCHNHCAIALLQRFCPPSEFSPA